MAGKIVLAGGDELRPGCEEMDRNVLQAAGGPNAEVVFLPTAAARHYPRAAARTALDYFGRLGARCTVAMILTRQDAARPEYVSMIEGGSLIYLAGGDPDVLLEVLAGSAAWVAALRVYEQGGVVGGSSAGAMAVCSHTLLPDRRAAEERPWVPGLGLVPHALVLPHYAAPRATLAATLAERLSHEVAPTFSVLGIPEHVALLGSGAMWEVVGPVPVTVFTAGRQRAYRPGEPVTLGNVPGIEQSPWIEVEQ
jgi:cyanophycinase